MSKQEVLKRINAKAIAIDTNLDYQKVAESFRNESKSRFSVTEHKKIVKSAQAAVDKLIEMYGL